MRKSTLFHTLFFVFVMGTESMALEMGLSRLLAPLFGTSLFVWGAVIGMVLTSLSIGYWVGGRIADKNPEKWRMFAIGGLASTLISLVTVLFDVAFSRINTAELVLESFGLVVLFFVCSLIFFAAPIFFFSMIVPYAVRVVTTDVKDSGKLAGNIFAFSTIGSILGVFIPSFITIPYIGVRETIFGFAFVGAVFSMWHFRKKWWALPLAILPIFAFFLSTWLYESRTSEDIFAKQTPYQLVRVAEAADGKRQLLINAGFGVQSVYDPNSTYSDSYWDNFSVFPYIISEPSEQVDMLVLGMAGGTIPKQMRKLTRDDFNLDIVGVDIDPELKNVAEHYFDSNEKYQIDDARSFVQKSARKYDIIVVDVYGKESFIPPHLSSAEFFIELREKLTEEGIVVVNINAPSQESPFYKKFVQTFAASNTYSYSMRANELWNYLLIGSNAEVDFSNVEQISNEYIEPMKKWFRDVDSLEYYGGEIFTDNKSDIEELTMQMYFEGFN